MIISDSMAKQVFPNENPIGKMLRSWRDENVYREIVGIVGDIHFWGLTDDVVNLVCVPHRQNAWQSMILVIHTSGAPASVLPSIRDEIWARDARLAIAEVRTMDEVLSRTLAVPRFCCVDTPRPAPRLGPAFRIRDGPSARPGIYLVYEIVR